MRLALAYLFLVLLFFTSIVSCNNQSDKLDDQSATQAAATPDFSNANTENIFVFNCGDTLSFTAHVTADSTWLFLKDTTVKVMPVPSASGARYEGSSYLYWSKGDEAILQKPTCSFMTCHSIPQERSWAAAQLRGVDFRALGQEPGWYLEITKNKQITYIGNYGRDTVTTPTPKPEINQQGKLTVYRYQTENHTLEIVITDSPCTDVMSGFSFPSTVEITVDGETYRGCGRSL
jgi:uncharacterized membrane protein